MRPVPMTPTVLAWQRLPRNRLAPGVLDNKEGGKQMLSALVRFVGIAELLRWVRCGLASRPT